MYRIILFSLIFLISIGCKKKEKDDKGLLLGAAILASQSASTPAPPATTEGTYKSGSTHTINVGSAVTLKPENHVEGSTYTVTPALPAGLTLGANPGVISGTPTTAVASTEYTVTQTKPDGTTTETAATPTFSPVAGTYNSDQSVSITTTTSGATIYYTDNGSEPTTSSTQYSAAISIAGHGTTKTIKAIAVKSGMTNSSVASAAYTINYDAVATPTFSPVAGTYNSDQSVSITTTTSGATIYYTQDGSEPTTLSTQYSSAISIAGHGTTKTIKAIAVKSGMINSSVVSATYTITYPVATPTFSPAAGNQTTLANIAISTTTTDATIYYTTDGSDPTTSSTQYSTALANIWSLAGKTIKALSVKAGFVNSVILTGIFSYPPLKTGQTTVYTAGDNGTNQSGVARGYTDNSNGTVTDNATGLVWQKCFKGRNNDSTCSDDAGVTDTATWADAGTYCSGLSLASGTWRLPSRQELETLPDYSKSSPAIDTTAFPGTVADNYWSSTTFAFGTDDAFRVNFNNGYVDKDVKTASIRVRCVSGPSKDYTSKFTDNNDGTIKDNATGLVWQKCFKGRNNDSTCSDDTNVADIDTWANAINYCSGLNTASRTWRLPTINELKTILDTAKTSGATIDTTAFPGTAASGYWSSTTYKIDTDNVWYVGFFDGYVVLNLKTASIHVRCVSGP
jgi:formylglycine-generating enzyme required for sulfatase activity